MNHGVAGEIPRRFFVWDQDAGTGLLFVGLKKLASHAREAKDEIQAIVAKISRL